MGDIIDKAQQYDEFHRERAVDACLTSLRQAAAHAPVIDCIDCGEEIPEARRRAVPTAARCIGCQEKHERRTRN
jgi:phage/conjugal plasmid C-4 type zinc finger TraR family protein